ncbi:Short-chain dehydrogenase/reductase SDR [Penicillium expansum]|nr:Short-chain dehydrogenase/reductase SDR [Penicillium expansum]
MESGIPSDPPSRSLAQKVAIVTGAGCLGDGIGNGRAISILLASDGCDVICVDLNLEWANKTVEIVNSKPGRGRALAIHGRHCQAAVRFAVEQFGRLDILINNVGIGGAAGTAVEVDMMQWAKSMEINVASMVQMAKYAIPEMSRNDGEIKGSIVNMGSVAGLKGGTPHLLYPTAKGAIVNMTRAMAAHHSPDGIRVNCMLYTPMMYGKGMSEEAREARRKRSLLGTEGNGWDCAGAVVFLAGPHARWMTGVILPVDAGTTAAVGIGMTKSASVNAQI